MKEPRATPRPMTARILNVLLVVGALAYVAYATSAHMDELRAGSISVSPVDIAGFTLLATASISLSTLYHALLVSTLVSHPVDGRRLGKAYALGQIVRYLPGKVMGLLFQANALRGHVSAGTIAFSLLIQMLLAYCCASAIAFAILASNASGQSWPLLLLLPAAGMAWVAQRAGWAQRALRWLPYIGRHLGGERLLPPSPSRTSQLTFLLLGNWLPFLAGWAWLLRSTHSLGEALVFAAAYLAASIVSTAMIVVPSGIVVREAVFIWIGAQAGLATSELLVYSVLARLALTGADLLNALLFWIIDLHQSRSGRSA